MSTSLLRCHWRERKRSEHRSSPRQKPRHCVLGYYAISVRRRATPQRILFEQVRPRRTKEANVQLICSAELHSNFLGQISDELRTPLTSLTAFPQILDDRSDSLSRDLFLMCSVDLNATSTLWKLPTAASVLVEKTFERYSHRSSESTTLKLEQFPVISREDIWKVFTPFFRVDNAEVRAVPGAGLWLTIVKLTVELHDGHVYTESEINVGTTISFTISDVIWDE